MRISARSKQPYFVITSTPTAKVRLEFFTTKKSTENLETFIDFLEKHRETSVDKFNFTALVSSARKAV